MANQLGGAGRTGRGEHSGNPAVFVPTSLGERHAGREGAPRGQRCPLTVVAARCYPGRGGDAIDHCRPVHDDLEGGAMDVERVERRCVADPAPTVAHQAGRSSSGEDAGDLGNGIAGVDEDGRRPGLAQSQVGADPSRSIGQAQGDAVTRADSQSPHALGERLNRRDQFPVREGLPVGHHRGGTRAPGGHGPD